ncbi:MAG: HemK family protein methyltransferase, partial [Burkholderiaceae bacterium]
AMHFHQAKVLASDLSEDALSLCRENLTRHDLQTRIEAIQSDLFSEITNRRFDLILCNPPYVNDASMCALPNEFLAEPDAALRGGYDGMEVIARILEQAPDHLTEHGLIVIEIGHEAQGFEDRFSELEFSYLPVTAGDQMVVVLTRFQLIEGVA